MGVVGADGGREFPLSVDGFDDYQKGSDVTYVLGEVYQTPTGSKRPDDSQPGERNDPDLYQVELGEVVSVYLRKSEPDVDDDDRFHIRSATVELFAGRDDCIRRREFETSTDIWLAYEYGQWAWLRETTVAYIRGVKVRLESAADNPPGRDDRLYLGIFGRNGGRELPVAARGFNDYEADSDVTYVLGAVPVEELPTSFQPVIDAEPGELGEPGGRNDPAWYSIGLGEVDYVYLRKREREVDLPEDDQDYVPQPVAQTDREYHLDSVTVDLYSDPAYDSIVKRTFASRQPRGGFQNGVWLGYEHGQKVWLREVDCTRRRSG